MGGVTGVAASACEAVGAMVGVIGVAASACEAHWQPSSSSHVAQSRLRPCTIATLGAFRALLLKLLLLGGVFGTS
jgi:hypothetical protein